jgi:serine/threonine protein kinase
MSQALPKVAGYEIESELGRGGMGIVYRARRRATGEILALKLILIRSRSATLLELARFRVEAEAMACLDHPNIIGVREVGLVADYPYLALEFAGRGSLKDLIGGRPQPPRWSATMVRTLALAIYHAHGRGMLHRDLKPANVLLMEDGIPKVSDFGLVKFAAPFAKVSSACCTMPAPQMLDLDRELAARFAEEFHATYAAGPAPEAASEADLVRDVCQQCTARTGLLGDVSTTESVRKFLAAAKGSRLPPDRPPLPDLDDLTRSGSVLGSPRYMAPEQASGDLRQIGRATDIYALGGILYELLTGRTPFRAEGLAELLAQVASARPTPPRGLDRGIPEELDAICMKCLEKAPPQRYPSAWALAQDLSRFLGEAQRPTDDPAPAAGEGPGARLDETRSERPGDEKSPGCPSATRSWWPFGGKRSRRPLS